MAGIYSDPANHPGRPVDEEICDLTEGTIRRFNLIALDVASTSKVRIDFRALQIGRRGRRHENRISSQTPER